MKYLLLLSLILAFIGCEKDPYPGEGGLRTKPRGERGNKIPPNGLQVLEKYTVKEGDNLSIKMKASVPKPGKPIVWVEGLPPGAEFIEEDLEIKWQPGFYAGNDLKNPAITVRNYSFKVFYKSTEDEPNTSQTATVQILVEDTPRAFSISTSDEGNVDEGRTLEHVFDINSVDYPQGPFKVSTKGMPANTKIVKVTDTKYKLVFTPDYLHVKLNEDDNRCSTYSKDCKLYNGTIFVENPAKHPADKDVAIKIHDVRRPLSLHVPENTTQGLDVTFAVTSVDPNGEAPPKLKLISGRPGNGRGVLELTPSQVPADNLARLELAWKDIPLDMNGKQHTFEFESCVLGPNNCETKSVTFTVKVKKRPVPYFIRSAWKEGEIKFFKFDEEKTFRISAKVANDVGSSRTSEVSSITVRPQAMQQYVGFDNGYLTVRIDKPGIHNFELVAKSPYNVERSAGFTFEVFQKDRFRTIFLMNDALSAEAKFYKDVMGDVNLINIYTDPDKLTVRNFSGRDNLIIGTEVLADPSKSDLVNLAMKEIDNVVIASPLIKNMPTKFLEELENKFRVSILGRYSSIANAPDLNNMYFVARSEFWKPSSKIRLNLNSTKESHDPLIFTIGVDRKNCQDVMDFTNKDEVQGSSLFKIGVICDRPWPNRGRLALLGTEFSDLKTTQADREVPAYWLKKMLTTNLTNKESK